MDDLAKELNSALQELPENQGAALRRRVKKTIETAQRGFAPIEIRTVICGKDFSLSLDRDREKLRNLNDFECRIQWLDARAKLVLLEPYESALELWEEDQLGLILVTGLCAGISAAGSFLFGARRRGTGRDKLGFLKFIHDYMDCEDLADAPPENAEWADAPCCYASWLYDSVRSGLAHGFTVERSGFHTPQAKLLDLANPQEPCIDSQRLHARFRDGWHRYLQEVRESGPVGCLGSKFNARWEQLYLRRDPVRQKSSGAKKSSNTQRTCALCGRSR